MFCLQGSQWDQRQPLTMVTGSVADFIFLGSKITAVGDCSHETHPYMTTGKTIALTRQTFVGKVISLLFNMLSRLVIAFLPRSECLLISRLQSPSAMILEPMKIKSDPRHDEDLREPLVRRQGSHRLLATP